MLLWKVYCVGQAKTKTATFGWEEGPTHWKSGFYILQQEVDAALPFTWIPINDLQLLTTQNLIHSFIRSFVYIRFVHTHICVCVIVCRFGNAYSHWLRFAPLTHWLPLQFVSFIFIYLTAFCPFLFSSLRLSSVVYFFSCIFDFVNMYFLVYILWCQQD